MHILSSFVSPDMVLNRHCHSSADIDSLLFFNKRKIISGLEAQEPVRTGCFLPHIHWPDGNGTEKRGQPFPYTLGFSFTCPHRFLSCGRHAIQIGLATGRSLVASIPIAIDGVVCELFTYCSERRDFKETVQVRKCSFSMVEPLHSVWCNRKIKSFSAFMADVNHSTRTWQPE